MTKSWYEGLYVSADELGAGGKVTAVQDGFIFYEGWGSTAIYCVKVDPNGTFLFPTAKEANEHCKERWEDFQEKQKKSF